MSGACPALVHDPILLLFVVYSIGDITAMPDGLHVRGIEKNVTMLRSPEDPAATMMLPASVKLHKEGVEEVGELPEHVGPAISGTMRKLPGPTTVPGQGRMCATDYMCVY